MLDNHDICNDEFVLETSSKGIAPVRSVPFFVFECYEKNEFQVSVKAFYDNSIKSQGSKDDQNTCKTNRSSVKQKN